jgi:eukaryotic-like serine/threonine-protein kinase
MDELERPASEDSTTSDLRERLERTLRFTLLVFVLAAAGFLSAVTTIRLAIHGRIVTMPNLAGRPVAEAQNLLAARGLQLRVADRVYSPLPANSVVRQSPPPGEEMKVSQDANVVLSLGPQMIIVPMLAGKSLRTVRIQLLQAGLQLGEVSAISLPGMQPDTVLKQDPPAGSAAPSPHVDLLIDSSAPPVFYVMPSVIGLEQQEANRILAAAGLRVTKVNRVAQTGAAKGTVIGQTPPRGDRIRDDATVELGIAD